MFEQRNGKIDGCFKKKNHSCWDVNSDESRLPEMDDSFRETGAEATSGIQVKDSVGGDII